MLPHDCYALMRMVHAEGHTVICLCVHVCVCIPAVTVPSISSIKSRSR